MYILWLDRQNNPPNKSDTWQVARCTNEAKTIIQQQGIPSFIDFDFDYGIDEDGKPDNALSFLKWLAVDHPHAITLIQGYNIHSLDECGKREIKRFMYDWVQSIIAM